jgi:Rnl2 family RNA ligase
VTDWPFLPYPKIVHSLAKLGLDEGEHRRLSRVEWVASEKVHGANLCLATDGAELRLAKRKAWLTSRDRFFGVQTLAAELGEQVKAAFAALSQSRSDLLRLDVYGELYGGHYPHPQVPPARGAGPVQRGIWYAPDLRFLAFDVGIWTREGEPAFLDLDAARALLESVELTFAPELGRGTLNALLELPLEFETTLPQSLGLPPIADNLAEGYVVRPCRELLVRTPRGPARPLFKRKHPDFRDEPEGSSPRRVDDLSGPDPSSYALELLTWGVDERVNPNRVRSAESKIGSLQDDLEAVAREAVADVWLDLTRDHSDALEAIDGEERALLEAYLALQVDETIQAMSSTD